MVVEYLLNLREIFIRSAMLYAIDCWVKKQRIYEMIVIQMRIFKLDKWKYTKRIDLKWWNLLKDMCNPLGWKDEGESPKWFVHKRVIDTQIKKKSELRK